MARLGDDAATRTAKVLSLPTRAAILSMLLRAGPKTVKEIADHFKIHPNVARAHLDLMVEAGFLATETRRRAKGRPAKVYFTWEGEAGALAEAGVDDPGEPASRRGSAGRARGGAADARADARRRRQPTALESEN